MADPPEATHAEKNTDILNMIISCEMSPSMADSSAFRRLFTALTGDDYEFPDSTFFRKMLEDKCNDYMASVKASLAVSPAPFYSLAFCEWTNTIYDRYGAIIQKYFCITCSFLDPTDHTVKCHPIVLWYNDDDIDKELHEQNIESLLKKWPLDKANLISVAIQTKSTVLREALTALYGADKIIPCFAHALNTVASRPFKEKPFKMLTKQIDNLADYLLNLKGIHLMTMGEVDLEAFMDSYLDTWGKSVDQMERFLRHQERIEELLFMQKEPPKMPEEGAKKEMQDLVAIYKPLKEVAKEVTDGGTFLSASKVIPLANQLQEALEGIEPETEIGKMFKELMMKELLSEFGESVEENEICAMGTICDPRYKGKGFKNEKAKEAAIEKLKAMVMREKGKEVNDDEMDTETQDPVSIYLSSATMDLKDPDPLKYFQEKDTELQSIAGRLLTCQALAGPPEKILDMGLHIPHNWSECEEIEDLQHLMFMASYLSSENKKKEEKDE